MNKPIMMLEALDVRVLSEPKRATAGTDPRNNRLIAALFHP